MKIDLKVSVVFALGLLIIIVIGVSTFIELQNEAESHRMVTHTHMVLEKLEHVLSLLKDAESGHRGYILTGEEQYLEPYNTAVSEIGKATDSLTSLLRDHSAQQQNLQELMQLSREKFDGMRESIKLFREGRREMALANVRSGRGKVLMDEIRRVVAQMDDREWQLLDSWNRKADEVALYNSRLVGIGMLLSLLVLSSAAIVMTHSVRLGGFGTQTGSSGRKWSGVVIRYSFALAMVALAMLVRQKVVSSFGPVPTFIMFYPAILLVATVAGGGPGILATVSSVLAASYWYFPPIGSLAIKAPNDAISLGIFGSASMFLCVFAERLNRARLAEAVSAAHEQELALLDMGNLLALDLDRRIVRWSAGSSRLYGFDAQEVQGRLVDELLQTRSSLPMEQINDELLKHGYWEGELSRRCKSGVELSLAILLALRRDEQGKPLAVLEVSSDITSQKRAEAALLVSEERYRTLVELSPDAITVIQDGRFVFSNIAAWQLYSAETADEIIGRPVIEVVHPDDRNLVFEGIELVLKGDIRHLREFRGIRRDGQEITLDTTGVMVNFNGRPAVLALTRNITERKRVHKELEMSEERLKLFIEYAPAGLAMFDRDMRYLYVSRRWLSDYGLEDRNVMGVSHYDLFPEISDQWKEAHRRGLAGEVLRAEADRFERADGSVQWVRWEIRPWYESEGLVGGIVIFAEEITARKHVEEALKKLNEELEERVAQRTEELREKDQILLLHSRQAAMGEMIGNIAHQWRQPLNTLGLTIQSQLLYYDLGEFTREFLNHNVNSSMELIKHMSKTIDDFRNYFRPDKEKVEFKLCESVANTLALIENSFKNQNIRIEVIERDGPAINGYQNEFTQVILNILNNALDAFTEREINDPRVVITISSEGGRAVVTISDNAGGIPEEIIEKIFDPYFTTKGPQTGTGVGLFMSKSIIEKNMNGSLTVQNTADGAEFRIEV